jgi:phosphoserine phosphatase RsbU/P
MIENYTDKWELEAKKLAVKSASRIYLLASIVVPFFAFFEYNGSAEHFKHFLLIFLGVSALMLLMVVLQKKFHLPSIIQIYSVSVVLACCFSYMATKTSFGNVHNYIMGISAITLVRGMIYFGKVIHLIIVTLINHTLAFCLLHFCRTEAITSIPQIESTLFFGVIFMIFSFAGMNIRYNLTKENYISSLKLQNSLDLIEEKQKEILDSIYYARRIQQALITSEKYIENKLGKLIKK